MSANPSSFPGLGTPVALAAAALLFLCACSGGSSSFEPPTDPEPPPPSGTPAIGVEVAFPSLSFDQPLAMLQAPGDDSAWYVVERPGTIRVFPNGSDAGLADVDTFADLAAEVSTAGEGGLLGMAFDPDFATNGAVYLSYTRVGLESVISRFTVDASGNLDMGSEEILLTMSQPNTNHNGGNLAFGPDGFLYIGFGDGGGSGDPGENGQDPTNLLGTILRIDVGEAAPTPYGIPPDNPFANNTECFNGSSGGTQPCPEIHAYGFRNPWRFSFDRDTGELWVGDVGQNAWEEVDRVERSMNYGWDEREGAHCFEPASGCDTDNVDPVTEYDHSLGSSITGGYVYRGDAIPGLQGFYVFGDYGSGRLWAVPFDSAQGAAPTELADTALNIASFAEGNDGELFVLHINGGTIHRIVAN